MAATSLADAGGNGQGAEHANEKAGANEKAANNPHAQEEAPAAAAEEQQAEAAAPQQTAAAQSTTASSGDSSKANRGCNQTPYGSGGNGANTSGPYNDTCTGAASQNGNGGGGAGGKPCAGCVGKADEKNPPGQQPGPSDKNKGYECDGNKGIGKGNPAHTGCTSTNNPPPPPPDDEEETDVEGETLTRVTPKTTTTGGSSSVPTVVLGEVFERPAGTLALTGAEVRGQVMAGAALLLFGFGLVLATRRRSAAE